MNKPPATSRSPPRQPNKQPKHDKKKRSVNFDTSEEANAPLGTASSRRPSAAETRDRRASIANNETDTDTEFEMDVRRPPFHRHSDGKSEEQLLYTPNSSTLKDERGRRRASVHGTSRRDLSRSEDGFEDRFGRPIGERPQYSRTSTMRSISPGKAAAAIRETKSKYTYAAFFLGLSLVSFVVQTETAVYIQHDLGWSKAYAMLYLTHSSWILLYPFLLLILRFKSPKSRSLPWKTFWRRHTTTLKKIAHSVEFQSIHPFSPASYNPIPYLIRTVALVTCSLTVAGGSWYVAVNLTSPSDLTAIYNCSAFFAYAFSVPLLNEPLRWDKSLAVLLAIAGVLIIAYGDEPVAPPPPDSAPSSSDPPTIARRGGGGMEGTSAGDDPANRLFGNLIIGIGSVLYGLYEVLYKRLCCPPSHPGSKDTKAKDAMIFAILIGSCIGAFTLTALWLPIPVLHWMGWEVFELPSAEAAKLLIISVGANVVFSGSFLVLISLTSPVLSSVAALLTIFLVALTDWLWTGKPIGSAALLGGSIIVVAFGMLSWSTWVEMREEAKGKEIDDSEQDGDQEAFLGV